MSPVPRGARLALVGASWRSHRRRSPGRPWRPTSNADHLTNVPERAAEGARPPGSEQALARARRDPAGVRRGPHRRRGPGRRAGVLRLRLHGRRPPAHRDPAARPRRRRRPSRTRTPTSCSSGQNGRRPGATTTARTSSSRATRPARPATSRASTSMPTASIASRSWRRRTTTAPTCPTSTARRGTRSPQRLLFTAETDCPAAACGRRRSTPARGRRPARHHRLGRLRGHPGRLRRQPLDRRGHRRHGTSGTHARQPNSFVYRFVPTTGPT